VTHPDLNELVALARRDRPTAGLLAAVARGLRVPFVAVPFAAVVMPSTAMAGALAKAGLSRLALLGWGAGGTVVASGVVLAVAFSQPSAPSAPSATVAPPSAVVQPASKPMAAPVPEPAAELDAAVAPNQPVRPVKEAPAAVWDEPQLIEKARRALAADPRRALALAQEHQRRFPVGSLGVEREVIALEALARLGQTAEAKRRALAFEAKYPRSIHLPRVRALLARLGR
jgi:hypothetical protein